MEMKNETVPVNTVIGWYEGITFVATEEGIMFYDGMPKEYAITDEAFTADSSDLKLLKPLCELKCERGGEILAAALKFFDEYIAKEDNGNV